MSISDNPSGTLRDDLPDPLGSTVALLDSGQAKTDTFNICQCLVV